MHTEFVPYSDHDKEFKGFLASPSKKAHPTVILCHAWNGRDDYICEKAKLIAGWGYTAFAIDIYGKGVLGHSPEENAALKQPFLSDRSLLKQHIESSYEAVYSHPFVDKTKIAVLGFGFGGLCALDFARYYKTLKGAISVYGHYDSPSETSNKMIGSKILLLHGYEDPVVTLDELNQFQEELTAANVDWQTHLYSQSMHAFTTPTANRPNFGIAYNPHTTKKAWRDIRNFLEEIL